MAGNTSESKLAVIRTEHSRGTASAWAGGSQLLLSPFLFVKWGPAHRAATILSWVKKTRMTRSYCGLEYLSKYFLFSIIAPTREEKNGHNVCVGYFRGSLHLQCSRILVSVEITPCLPLPFESPMALTYLSTGHLVNPHVTDWGPAVPHLWVANLSGIFYRK